MYPVYYKYCSANKGATERHLAKSKPIIKTKNFSNQVSGAGTSRSLKTEGGQSRLSLNPLTPQEIDQASASNGNGTTSIQPIQKFNRVPISSLVNNSDNATFLPPDEPHIDRGSGSHNTAYQIVSSRSINIPSFVAGTTNIVSPNRAKIENAFKKHKCPTCNRRFTQKAGVKQHVKAVHLKIKDQACGEPGCDKVYSTRGDLTRHTNSTHLGKRPFLCICDRRYTKKTALIRHIEVKKCGPAV